MTTTEVDTRTHTREDDPHLGVELYDFLDAEHDDDAEPDDWPETLVPGSPEARAPAAARSAGR